MNKFEQDKNLDKNLSRDDGAHQQTQKESAGPSFEFINLTGDESQYGHTNVTRKRVRTHARRHPVDGKKPKAKTAVDTSPESPKFEFINLSREPHHSEKDESLKKKVRVHAGKSRAKRPSIIKSDYATNESSKGQELGGNLLDVSIPHTDSSSSSERALTPWTISEVEDISMSLVVCQDSTSYDDDTGTWTVVRKEEDDSELTLSRYQGRASESTIPPSIQFNTDRYLGSYNLPHNSRPRISVLVHQLLSLLVDTQIILAVNPEQDWISFAAMDTALFHASLAVSAIYYDTGSTGLIHSQETIKVVSRRLSESSSQMNNVTIAAVALLVLHDTLSETTANSALHMSGLEQMVTARGGLKALPGRLGITLAMIDVFYATTWDCLPRFPMTYPNPEAAMDLQNLALRGIPDLEVMSLTRLLAPNWEMADIMHVSKLLAISFQIWPLSLADRTALNDSLYLIRYRLLKRPDNMAPFPEPFRLATMIYLNLLVRRMPYTNTSSLVIKLADSILVEDLACYDPGLAVWILVIGGCVARGPRERHIFVEGLLQVCDVSSWEDFEKAFERVLALDRACKLQCVELWKDMETRKGTYRSQLVCNTSSNDDME